MVLIANDDMEIMFQWCQQLDTVNRYATPCYPRVFEGSNKQVDSAR